MHNRPHAKAHQNKKRKPSSTKPYAANWSPPQPHLEGWLALHLYSPTQAANKETEMKRKSKRNTGDGANQQMVTQRVNIRARKEGGRLLVETTVELAGGKRLSLTVAAVGHRQQLLNRVCERGLLPLQRGAVERGADQLTLQPTDQSTLPLHQLLELLLLALQAVQLLPIPSLQR
ncbi:hypothetical protein EYF80_001624 [Liparis tanakae]|uniref:Uncharacterized protein n=1 Tax=Liparis tanakae TaxID=230148 RepID=A0A4Z2JE51_9TELE|nr:hypothetical protein EYF80_001624 [Liparis tanakae]